MFQKIITVCFLFILPNFLAAQSLYSKYPILDSYINEALESNLSLKQKEFSFQKSISALNQAKGLFLPSVNIEARYSRAGGGRMIEFPIGDMLNPVYQSLNEILDGMGLDRRPFPTLKNETIPFLREKEHDTKLRVIQPVFQPKVYYNYKIKSGLKEMSELDIRVFKRHLIADIKTAYYSYLKTAELVDLLSDAKKLLQENLRVSQKLFENQKITRDGVLRSNAELAGLKQKLIAAQNNKNLAASYFNFLLNAPLDSGVQDIGKVLVPASTVTQQDLAAEAIKRREEIQQFQLAIELAAHQKSIESSSFLPDMNLVGDYGYQGETYKLDQDHDYWMVSGLLQWNLFKGFSDYNGRQLAEIDKQKLLVKVDELKQQIHLQVQKARLNYQSAEQMVVAASEEQQSADETFHIVRKKYEAGMVPLISFLDARNSMTSAGMNKIIAIYDLHIKKAELEKVSCVSNL